MSTSTREWPSIYRWVDENKGLVWLLFVHIASIVFAFLTVASASNALWSATLNQQTAHQLDYLPADFRLAQEVINEIENGDAVALGAPQENISLAQFEQGERQDRQYVLSVEHSLYSSTLYYWDFYPEKVVQAALEIPVPTVQRLGITGWYRGETAEIVDGNLLISRSLDYGFEGFLFLVLIFLGVLATYQVVARILVRIGLKRARDKRFEPRA